MLVYLFLYAGSFLFGIVLCGDKFGKWGKIIYCAGTGIVFFFVSALRFSTGYDYNSYASIYDSYSYISLEDVAHQRLEKGFAIPFALLNQYFDLYTPLFYATSFLIIGGVFYLIYKYSSVKWVGVISFLSLGVFFNSLCFIRQFMAALVVAFAMRFINENKLVKYLLVVLMGAAFHWSALLMLPFYFILKIKPGYILYAAYTAVLAFIIIFSYPIFNFITDNLFMYSQYSAESAEFTNGLPVTYTVMFFVVFISAFLFRKRLAEKNKNNNIYINCIWFAVFFEAIGVKHAIISRFALLFFIPVVVALMPDLFVVIKEYVSQKSKSKKRLTSIITASVGLIASFSCYLMLILINYNGVMPYNSIINMNTKDFYVLSDEPPSGQTSETTEVTTVSEVPEETVPQDTDINIEDYYIDWDSFDWDEENWDD